MTLITSDDKGLGCGIKIWKGSWGLLQPLWGRRITNKSYEIITNGQELACISCAPVVFWLSQSFSSLFLNLNVVWVVLIFLSNVGFLVTAPRKKRKKKYNITIPSRYLSNKLLKITNKDFYFSCLNSSPTSVVCWGF